MPRGITKKEEPNSTGLSKMEMVRQALGELGSDAKPPAIHKWIKSKFRLDLGINSISAYKTMLNKQAGEKRSEPTVEEQPEDPGISKLEAVRRALTELGDDPKPLAIQEHIKTQFGIEMELQRISSYKSHLKAASKSAIIRQPRERGADGGGFSLEDIQAVKALADRIGAETVRQLAEVLSQ